MTDLKHRSAAADTSYYLDAQVARARDRRASGRVPDAHFGFPRLGELADLHEQLGDAIRLDILRGATVHRRPPRTVRLIPWVVAVLDVVILFSFCADIFKVAVDDPGATPIAALAALFLAVLGGGVGYAFLAMTGHRLCLYRTKLGEVQWQAVGLLTWLMIAVSGMLTLVLALLMRARVTAEIVAAGGDVTDQALLLGVIFAVLSAVANATVLVVHALDGSTVAHDHARAGRLLRRYDKPTANSDAADPATRADPDDGQAGDVVVSLPLPHNG